MSNYKKKGHPALAIVLGIIGIILALILTFATGIVGGILAGVLGLAALLIGIFTRKSGGKGMGGMIVGAVAILLAVLLTFSTVSGLKAVREKAEQSGEAPLVAKYLNNPELGVLGILLNVPQDEGTIQEVLDQVKKMQ